MTKSILLSVVVCLGCSACATSPSQSQRYPSGEVPVATSEPKKVVLPLPHKEVWTAIVRMILFEGGKIQSLQKDRRFIACDMVVPAIGIVFVKVEVQESDRGTVLGVTAASKTPPSMDVSEVVLEKLKIAVVPTKYEWLK